MTKKQYRLNKWGTRLLKNNRPLFDWSNDSDNIVDLLNDQEGRIKQLEEENYELQFKIIDMLDFVKEKGMVTREEIKKWWNGDVE